MTVPVGTTAATDAGHEAEAASRRRRHSTRWLALAVLVVGAALVAVLATSPNQQATEVDTPLVGQAAPAIDSTTLSGAVFHLSDYRGRWVVLNFFASWCPPCQQEEAELVTFAYGHRAPGAAALVGVVFDDSAATARRFMQSSGATWPAVLDPGGQVALQYGVRGPPETFIVSPDGEVVAHFDGPMTDALLDDWLSRAQTGAT